MFSLLQDFAKFLSIFPAAAATIWRINIFSAALTGAARYFKRQVSIMFEAVVLVSLRFTASTPACVLAHSATCDAPQGKVADQ